MNRRDLVSEWLRMAERDLDLAALAMEHRPDYADLICFHAQQAAEKCLKALLVALDIPPPKTHSLAYLVDLAVERRKAATDLYDTIEPLEGYAVEARYPGMAVSLTAEDAQRAYEFALAARQQVGRILAEDDLKELNSPNPQPLGSGG